MPIFNLSIIKKKKSINKRSNRYTIDIKNVIGVVHIDVRANYYIVYNDTKYDITDKSYSCKGKQIVYPLIHVEANRLVYIRNISDLCELNPLYYLPFNVGCIVKGDIIVNNDTKEQLFDIKKCYTERNNYECIKAINFYKEHKDEIYNSIKQKRIDRIRCD